MGKVIAAYGGGFKPPTKGHLEVVKRALAAHPEIDEFIIYVGGKERDGIGQTESLLIWDIFKKYLPMKVKIEPSKLPIKDVLSLGKNNPEDTVYFVIGGREGRQDDLDDIANRTKNVEKTYPNMQVKVQVTPDEGMSGTNARKAAKISSDKLSPYLPDELTDKEKEEVFNIIRPVVNEAKDPKKGTGKKPEGSSRRLYTDEDPKDTVGIKFSTRQDIVDTLNKASFKAKSHARQSQIINLIHQRVRAAYGRAKDPKVKKRLKTGLDYITDRKEASKKKTQRLKNQKNENIAPNHNGKAAPFGSGYDKVNTNVNEEITKSQLDSIEAYADRLFAKLGIDIEFTKHFLDRVNDERNKKPITVPELIGMFKRLHKKHGKPLSKVDDDFDAVVKDFNNNINIPFAINVTPNDIDLVAKTVMRKKDFKTSTPVIALNENASYQKDINLIEKLATLTQHMLDKGMNIEPLPNLEFVNGDSENARDFFGKTAYYDPTSQTIVLYTEGRHPKDIARSYTHEMIHHIQNLEGRLGNITTTNTQEDDDLNKIEAEANLKGTMTFRNWTDSLEEKQGFDPKLGKDPFGLNQFAREIAEGVLSEGRYDKFTNQISKIVFEAFKDIHDRGDKRGEFEFSIGPDDEDIFSDQFEFDLAGVVEITDDEYVVDGGANAGFDNKGEEITPLLSVKFKIPKNPNWQEISFDIKDVVRHELEHLTQDGLNVVPGKQMGDDELLRQMIDMDLLPKADYFKLAKEIDAMLQGLYFKAKKSKQSFGSVINDYLDKVGLDNDEKESVLKIWRSRRKALSLPLFENELDMDYKIFSDMDGVITDFNNRYKKYAGMMPAEYEKKFGKDKFWELADAEGVAFWVGMPWMEDGKDYWNYIKDYNVELLSSPSRSETSRLGKRLWVRNNLPGIKLTLAQAYNKQNYAAPNHILIDDRESNIEQWRDKGGIGILHTSAADTIQQLKDLGL